MKRNSIVGSPGTEAALPGGPSSRSLEARFIGTRDVGLRDKAVPRSRTGSVRCKAWVDIEREPRQTDSPASSTSTGGGSSERYDRCGDSTNFFSAGGSP